MGSLLSKQEFEGFTAERVVVVAASYTGSENLSTDFTNAKAELDKLFNDRWFDLACDTADQLAYTIQDEGGAEDFITTYGAIDDRIVPFVTRQKNGVGEFVKVPESEYTVNRTAGTITFSAEQGATDVIRATVCGNIKTANNFDGGGSINITQNKSFILGTETEAYKWTRDEGADPNFSFDVIVDVSAKHNLFPGEQALKMIYGDDWTEAAAAASGNVFSDRMTWNQLIKNADPFFCCWVMVRTDTSTGEVAAIGEFYHGCEMDELPATKGIGDRDAPATVTFKGLAKGVYHFGGVHS
ncbi:MAG: hypothetical protein JW885_02835 [Deltaproteobacteria bacterium]|nr:hypothetical protein [Candidatus Zymogenaceae bacterium]